MNAAARARQHHSLSVATRSSTFLESQVVGNIFYMHADDSDKYDEWQAAIDEGIDVSQLEYLLTLTPAERLLRHEQAVELVRAVRQAGIKHYGFDPRDLEAAERLPG
jgi:hypothetical protein